MGSNLREKNLREYGLARRVWRVAYPVLIYFGVTWLAVLLSEAVIRLLYAASIAEPDGFVNMGVVDLRANKFMSKYALHISLVAEIACISVLYPVLRKTQRRYPELGGGATSARILLLTAIVAICHNIIVVSSLALTDASIKTESVKRLQETAASGGFFATLLSAGIAGPLIEEICFRGIIVNRLRGDNGLRTWMVIVISALIFAVTHFSITQGVYSFFGGALCAFLYIRFRSLWIPILEHTVYNTFNIVMTRVIESFDSVELPYVVLLIAASVACVLSLAALIPTRYNSGGSTYD
jgi:membrane protease YdiL (CAAX protease family)